MELFFNEELNDEQSLVGLRKLVQHGQAIVCMPGSALKDEGILEFFDVVNTLTTTHFNNNANFDATVFKIRHDQQQRLTFMKSTAGILRVRDELTFGESTEKITEIRLYNGTNYTSVQQVEAGDIFAVKGLSTPVIGDVLGNEHEKAAFDMLPTLQAKVNYDGPLHVKELTRIFRELEAEEPSLRVLWNEQFQEISVHVMGVIQLEVLIEVLKERFSIDVTFGKPQILYKETIKESAIGYGHFEPLKHYAEVHIKLEPNPRGKGITFSNACHADDLTVGHQRLIEQHVFERDHHGLLTGFPITDIHVTLLTGRAHNKHTAGGDFREATLRGLRQGLEQVDNILLEPYYRFKMKASNEHIGRMMSDIQQASGTLKPSINRAKCHNLWSRTRRDIHGLQYTIGGVYKR